MLIDSKSVVRYRMYETGQISAYLSGAGNRNATGGQKLGKRQKKYQIDKKICRSTIIRQFNLKKNTIKFVTLTFPGEVTNNYANECFVKFIDNLKTNYNLNTFVAVKELTKIGRPHYHCFFDIPYVSYSNLNRAWCFTFRSAFPYSPNALTTRKGKSIIRTIKRAVNYASKYVTKVEDYINNPDYIQVTNKQYKDYIHNRLFFCDNFVKSNGYLIHSGLMDYLLSFGGMELYIDKDYFQVYFLVKWTPSLQNMLRYIDNYMFFMQYFKIKRSFYLFFICFFLFFLFSYRKFRFLNIKILSCGH